MMQPAPKTAVNVDGLPLLLLSPIWVETEHQVNRIPSARVVLSVPGNPTQTLTERDTEMARCEPGASATLTVDVDGHDVRIFTGVVMRQELKVRRGQAELTLVLRHGLQSLAATHGSRVFAQMTDEAIVRQLLRPLDVALTKCTGLTTTHEQLVQFRCSDWHFLRSRLNVNGVWLMPSPEGAEISQPFLSPAAAHKLYQSLHDVDEDSPVDEGEWHFSDQSQADALSVSTWDVDRQVCTSAKARSVALGSDALNPAAIRALNPATWLFGYSAPLSVQESENLANALLMNLQAAAVQGDFVVTGSVDYELGQTVQTSGYGSRFDGKGIVTCVRHRIGKESGWRTQLRLGLDEIVQDASLVPRANGPHVGVIAPFEMDSTAQGRIRIKLAALGAGAPVLWARFASPYATNAAGFCFYPEVGDEVVVAFFDDNPSYPVIVGAMFNPVNKAPFQPDKESLNKVLVVKGTSGNLMLSFDKKEESLVASVDGSSFALKQGVTMTTSEPMSISARGVSLAAQESLEMSGDADVKIKGPRIDLTNG
ncbi:phage baseplate assembly protein V [Paraburkholderia sp. D15]|uniref:phage baseplate assembly protein V n=1 Tax=Paraburkholderia sp. D15 TaxID=2880218 RepID=UPI00247B0403|nr:phage baseplate assembly protein V [Paraburkholderia sp. D15]WGS53956.1 phage baseplate assembly protein V [Paraburkholderia sp. D15]